MAGAPNAFGDLTASAADRSRELRFGRVGESDFERVLKAAWTGTGRSHPILRALPSVLARYTYPRVAEEQWQWGSIGTIATGADGAFPDESASNVLVDLVYALKAGYRQNATWVMNRRTQAEIRKLKDADGNHIWQAPAGAESHATLMGFPIVEAEEMPDIGASTAPIAFGDFARGYLVVDRTGLRVLRDPFSAKPYVLFYTTKRVGGGVQDFDAIKLLSFEA